MSGEELVTAGWLAASCLPGIPTTRGKVRELAAREGWAFEARRVRGGFARMYAISSLPAVAQVALTSRLHEAPAPSATLQRLDDVPDAHLERARAQLLVVTEIADLVAKGATITSAVDRIATAHEQAARSARRWFEACREVPRGEWLAVLLPKWCSRTPPSACHADAWAWFVDDYLRLAKPTYASCYERLVDVARAKGWEPIPSLRALIRRVDREIPITTQILRREGAEALERLYPAQQRSRAHMHALYGVTADGHKFDFFVNWPGIKKPVRVVFVAWQDLYSGMILGWRIDATENADVIRLSLGDVVEHYGIPENAWLDNGRGFASKLLTGGTTSRFRFTIRPEDPKGILTELVGGDHIHWTTPYHGQSKPIERAFRDLCETIAKHPGFQGAYTGNRPDAKPEDHGSRAVSLEYVLSVVGALIKKHNERPGRTTEVCKGRSFAETFAESYARTPIRRATDAQRRLLMLAAEGLMVRKSTASLHMLGARYWHDDLIPLKGQRVVVRFDPHALGRGVFVYRLDGTYVCMAKSQGIVPFDDTAAAKEHAKNRGEWRKAKKKLARAAQRYTPAELAADHLSAIGVETPPASNVVKGVFGIAKAPAEKTAAIDFAPTAEEIERRTSREDMVRDIGRGMLASLEGARRRSAG